MTYTTQNALLYRGYELHVEEPAWIADAATDVTRRVVNLATEIGPMRQVVHNLVSKSDVVFGWHLDGRPDIDAFMDFLYRRRGMFEPVWMPSWKHDLWLVADALDTDTTITIRYCGYTARMYPYENRKHIILLDPVSAYVIRRVTSSVDNGDGTETLTLESALGKAFTVRATEICFLLLLRQKQDATDLLCHARDLYTASVVFTEIPEDINAGSGQTFTDSDPPTDEGSPAPETCLQIWNEGFDQADLTAFEAAGYTINHFKNPSGGTYPTASVTVAGSKLTVNGVGNIGISGLNYYGITFQKAISPIANVWIKVDFDIEGGTWDAFNSNIFVTPEHWVGTPITIFGDSDFVGGQVLKFTQAGPNSSPFDFDTRLYGNDTDGENDVSTATSKLLTAGSYSFIIWCGELTTTTQRMELWINPTPGDPADATNDVTKVSGEKFSALRVFPLAPESIGKAVSVTHVEAWRGPRTCDPFGIL